MNSSERVCLKDCTPRGYKHNALCSVSVVVNAPLDHSDLSLEIGVVDFYGFNGSRTSLSISSDEARQIARMLLLAARKSRALGKDFEESLLPERDSDE